MNIYNTNINVTYYDIKTEMLLNFENNNSEYTLDEIYKLCYDLYTNEVSAVFYVDNLFDSKLTNSITYVITKMMENNDFKTIINSEKEYIKENTSESNDRNIYMLLSLTLLNQDMFHLFHKCACQQLTLGTIENNLLVQMQTYFHTN